uniref:glutathione S-transferase N-terminal domain-containing protein n=1 Tax=Pararhizobium sp. IMCC3301 TaxID=3067904 RepID=UPI0027416454|nr:glutathione S-transferase N-terminal domain-containing protein [Pararhizobium sp. IMCC3301]
MTIRLYDLCGRDTSRRFSPYCWRIKKALDHKKLAYETIAVPFTAIAGIEGNDAKTVPMLCDGDRSITDSFAIAEYLDEAYPQTPKLIDGAQARAMSRFVEAWTYSALHPGIVRMVAKDIHDILDAENQAYFRKSREKSLKTTLEQLHADRDRHRQGFQTNLLALDLMLRRQPFIGGATPNFADFIVYGSLKWPAACSDYDVLPQKPRILDWYAHLDT